MSERAIGSDDHAVAMDRMYRMTRHVYDASRKYYLLGRDRLIAELDLAGPGTILEIGCGTGRNLIAAAALCPQARFYGIDISEVMLEKARAEIDAAGLSDRIVTAKADAARLSPRELFGVDQFDRVFFSYTLSMIPDWRGALLCGAAALAPDGRLSVVDFGAFERLPGFVGTSMRRWLDRFHVTPRDDLADTLAAMATDLGRSLVVNRPYRGYAQHLEMR